MVEYIAQAVSGEISWSTLVFIVIFVGIILLLTWFSKKAGNFFVNLTKSNKHDLEVYKNYKTMFSQDFVDFLNIHNFEGAFQQNKITTVNNALDNDHFNQPEYTFHNSKLKKQSSKVINSLAVFFNYMNQVVNGVIINGEVYLKISQTVKDPDGEKRNMDVEKLNDLSSNIYSEWINLEKICLKKFDTKIDNSILQD